MVSQDIVLPPWFIETNNTQTTNRKGFVESVPGAAGMNSAVVERTENTTYGSIFGGAFALPANYWTSGRRLKASWFRKVSAGQVGTNLRFLIGGATIFSISTYAGGLAFEETASVTVKVVSYSSGIVRLAYKLEWLQVLSTNALSVGAVRGSGLADESNFTVDGTVATSLDIHSATTSGAGTSRTYDVLMETFG